MGSDCTLRNSDYIVALLVGIMLLIAGIGYAVKEKDDAESKKIGMITGVIGAVITVFIIVKMFL